MIAVILVEVEAALDTGVLMLILHTVENCVRVGSKNLKHATHSFATRPNLVYSANGKIGRAVTVTILFKNFVGAMYHLRPRQAVKVVKMM